MNLKHNIERYVLFSSPVRKPLAEKLVSLSPEHFELHDIEQKFFEDGEPNFKIDQLHGCFNQDVLYIADWSNPAARYYDLCILVPLAELGPRTLTILVPFMGSGTMERESTEGIVATANVDARLLSNLPNNVLTRVVTVDLHTLQNQFYFHNCAVWMYSVMPWVRDMIQEKSIVVCFPDDGAKKRFAQYFTGCDIATCAKVRIGNERRVTLDDGDVEGRQVLIVDDLTRTGGTLLECAKALKEHQAKEISIFVSHAVFPQQQWRKFVDNDLIHRFYTTDSVPNVTQEMQAADPEGKHFEIWELADCIRKAFFEK